jgi:hypothetical protein
MPAGSGEDCEIGSGAHAPVSLREKRVPRKLEEI